MELQGRAGGGGKRSLLGGKYQKKSVILDGHEFILHGLPGDDHYFANIGEKNCECLLANIEANGLNNVEVLNAAIGARTSEVKFHEHFAFGHVSAEGATVPMMTIDDLARRFSLDRIYFIKIDVEGYEYPILRSSLDLLNQYGSLIYFEFNSWCQVAIGEA